MTVSKHNGAVTTTSEKGISKRWRERAAPYVFISPFFLGFVALQLLPIVFSILLSFTDWDGMRSIQWAGIGNFVTMFDDSRFWNSLKVTFVITIVCTILGTAGALTMAVLLEQVSEWLSSLLRAAFFLPSVTSVVVITYVWQQLYNADRGFFNIVLGKLGLPPQNWLTDSRLALGALIVMLIWAGLGWDTLIITSGLRAIPEEIHDAATVDGVNGWTRFWYITFPLLRSTLAFVMVTGVIFLWGLFAQPRLLTGGGPVRRTQTIALYLYDTGFQYHKFGYASAMALILSLIMFISSYINFKFFETDVEY
jgi:multiple sugar transport system permease protein